VWLEQVTKTQGAHTWVNDRIMSMGLFLKNSDEISIGGRIFRYELEDSTLPTLGICPDIWSLLQGHILGKRQRSHLRDGW
jgi:hypothetical protein